MDTNNGLRFTRSDLLMGAGVAGLAILLLIPMIVSSRSTARRAQCANNLRQVGIALLSYLEVNQSLPYAARWTSEDLPIRRVELQPRTGHATHQNWLQLLLPLMGEGGLAESFDCAASVTSPGNAKARTAELTVLKCPDDPYNRQDNLYTYRDPGRDITASFARGNYAINGGSQSVNRYPGGAHDPSTDGYHYAFDMGKKDFQVWGSGVAGINKAFRREDFRNGQSTLVAVNEVRAGIDPIDPRGVWALGQFGGSITFGHGVTGDDAGPNNQGDRADDVLGCGDLHKRLGADAIARERMPCCAYWELNIQATSRSLHEGGVNALMMDGSARFVSDVIDPSLWHAMHPRETPKGLIDKSAISAIGISSEVLANRAGRGSPDARRVAAHGPAEGLPRHRTAPISAHEPSHRPISQNRSSSQGKDFDGRSLKKVVNAIGMELVLVPAGEFTMGVPDLGNEKKVPPESPPHRVRITTPYYLGVYEVTQGQYERVMGKNPSWRTTSSGLSGRPKQDTDLLPVEQVSWEDATEFCRRLSQLPAEKEAGLIYRLPTEAEWEYACRSGESEPFPWSPAGNPRAGFNAGEFLESGLPVATVGSYPPNRFGLHDMRGNLYEWCADWFARDYYRRSPVEDPPGPASGYLHVVRGGDWFLVGEGCMINRRIASPWHSSPYLGFRVEASVSGEAKRPHPAPPVTRAQPQLAVYSSHRNPRSMELIELDPVRRLATLLKSGPAASPSWCPDGSRIAFVEAKSGLCVMDARGDHAQNLTAGAFKFAAAPAWSPDGSRIAFVATKDDAVWSLLVIDAGGGNLRTAVKSVGRQASPAWAPDGRQIWFVSSREGKPERLDLVATDPTGTEVRRVRENVPHLAAPAWSPDGGRVAFANWGKTGDQLKIVIAKPDGSVIAQVTDGDGFDLFPSWSRDGRWVAYVHFHARTDKRGDLVIHDVAGGTRRVVSRGTLINAEDSRPAWGPSAGRQESD